MLPSCTRVPSFRVRSHTPTAELCHPLAPYAPPRARGSFYAGPPSAGRTELLLPPKAHILPLQWNLLSIRCRDRCGNQTELPNPADLTVTCEGTAQENVRLRERT